MLAEANGGAAGGEASGSESDSEPTDGGGGAGTRGGAPTSDPHAPATAEGGVGAPAPAPPPVTTEGGVGAPAPAPPPVTTEGGVPAPPPVTAEGGVGAPAPAPAPAPDTDDDDASGDEDDGSGDEDESSEDECVAPQRKKRKTLNPKGKAKKKNGSPTTYNHDAGGRIALFGRVVYGGDKPVCAHCKEDHATYAFAYFCPGKFVPAHLLHVSCQEELTQDDPSGKKRLCPYCTREPVDP